MFFVSYYVLYNFINPESMKGLPANIFQPVSLRTEIPENNASFSTYAWYTGLEKADQSVH